MASTNSSSAPAVPADALKLIPLAPPPLELWFNGMRFSSIPIYDWRFISFKVPMLVLLSLPLGLLVSFEYCSISCFYINTTVYQQQVSRPDTIRKKISWLLIVVALYTSATIHAALSNSHELHLFTEHGGSPSLAQDILMVPPWYSALGTTVYAICILIADCLFVRYVERSYHVWCWQLRKIWRCWVVWGKRWIVVLIPILATVVGNGALGVYVFINTTDWGAL